MDEAFLRAFAGHVGFIKGGFLSALNLHKIRVKLDEHTGKRGLSLCVVMAGTLTGDSWAVVVAVLLLAAMGLQCAVDEMGPGGVAVFLASGSPVLILFLTWRRLGDGVKPGFVASMYLHSTILGVALSLVGELLASNLWSRTFPNCNLGLGGSSQMVISPMTERCEVLGLAAWLCIPGVFEETFKVVWVFYRLRRSLKEVPETCCCGACWSVSSMDCGWWFKLAPTPQHVLLAAVAAGAGFEAAENLNYGLATEVTWLQNFRQDRDVQERRQRAIRVSTCRLFPKNLRTWHLHYHW